MHSQMANTNTKTNAQWILMAIVAIISLIAIRTLPSEDAQAAFKHWIVGLGMWGPVAFVLVYVVATVCLFPGSLLTLIGGAVFGLKLGFALVSVASTAGASVAFLIARYAAREKVAGMAKSNAMFAALDEAISEGGWKMVALLRLSPVIAFNWQNYLYGLTRIRFGTYVFTSWIAMMPGTFLYVYLGTVAGAASTGESRSPWQWGLFIIGLLATIVVTVSITRLAREKLTREKFGGKTKLRKPAAITQAPNNSE